MIILVLNCGSSSLKAAVIDTQSSRRLCDLRVERIGPSAELRVDGVLRPGAVAADPAAAVGLVLEALRGAGLERGIAAIGHRVAHGGDRFVQPTRVDAELVEAIAGLTPLAPLHNPAALAGIAAAQAAWPALPHVAVFDTAFHATLPRRAREYALPRDLRERLSLRRYGFHGSSHAFVAAEAARHFGVPLESLRLVTCHLGSGCSVAAVEFGRSVDTSLGMTPLSGVPMATRPGDLDPGMLLYILEQTGMAVSELGRLLNRESGLKGLAGTPDMREIEERAARGDDDARLAIAVFAYQVRKYIGAYAAAMGGLDAVVFTGGIGENSALVRHRIAQRLDFLGAPLDEDLNRDARVGNGRRVAEVSEPHARVRLLVVATDEELQIARDAARLLGGERELSGGLAVPISISARHVHLTQASVEALFGPGATLASHRAVTQPGQFAAKQTVSLVGPKGRLDGVRIVGPARAHDQVEVSRTDEFLLGVDAPVRESGDIEHTPGIRIEGPAGAITLRKGVICAWRHV
ncbi:MAG: acetate/propionate family kinase, partial [Gammaproteobacteria bacterium]|nr:acetate/propionate family kinase [Gammaproteobacteria bacterium]